MRLGHQSTGSFFVPDSERPGTGDESPQRPRKPAIPPRRPAEADSADTGTDDTGTDDAAQAKASRAEVSPAEVSTADPGSAETSPVEASQAEATTPDPGPAETKPAGATPADAGPADASPADTSAADASTTGTGADPLPRRTPGSSRAGPGSSPRAPARRGSSARPAPKTAVPAVQPGGAPVTRPGTAPATRPETAPATRPETAPATRPAAGDPARRPAAEPSWGTVLVTTAGLWAKRRLEKPWLRVLLMLVLTAVVFLAGALTATLTRSSTTSSVTGGPTTGQGAIPGGTVSGGTVSGGGVSGGGVSGGGALAAVASARKQAATWVAQQVNPDEVIGCDPVMCAALEAAHVQANRLLLLGPSVPDPLGSEVLLDTATLRSQFGGRLETVYAPVSLAAFGSGAARVEIRFVVPDGAHAYLAELAGDVAARKAAGIEMLRNHSIHASPAARRQLAAGQVDTRLLVMLVTLAHNHPVDIISFGAKQVGASSGVPLRSAEIAGAPGPGSTPPVSVPTLRSFLSAQQPPYRPSLVAVTTASGRTVLRVGYPAPSLLGLLGTHG